MSPLEITGEVSRRLEAQGILHIVGGSLASSVENGNRVSDRQWNDILRVLDNQRATLDYAYMGRWARELGVDGLLEDALAQRGGEPDPFA